MANKREFKKYANAVGAMVFEEMMMAYYNLENADKQAISEAVGMVLDAVESARKNSNVYFDRGPKAFADHKEYRREKNKFFAALFNKIDNEFAEEVKAALKKFNEALPAEVKEAQKNAVAEK